MPSTWIIVAKGGDVLVPSVMLIGSFVLEVAAHIWRVIKVADHDWTVWKHCVMPKSIAAIVMSMFSFGLIAPKFAPVMVTSSPGATRSVPLATSEELHAFGLVHAMLVMVGAKLHT